MLSNLSSFLRPDKVALDAAAGFGVDVINSWGQIISTVIILGLRVAFEYYALKRQKAKEKEKENQKMNS